MIEYRETIYVVYIPSEKIHGTAKEIGLYGTVVTYRIDDVEYEELFDNDDFIILDEINFMHFEEND